MINSDRAGSLRKLIYTLMLLLIGNFSSGITFIGLPKCIVLAGEQKQDKTKPDNYARALLEQMKIPFRTETFLENVKNGDSYVVELFIEAGIGSKSCEDILSIALCEAISEGHSDIVRILLDQGANVNAKFPTGTPLKFAIQRDNITILKILFDRGVEFNIDEKELVSLSVRSQSKVLKFLEERGIIKFENNKHLERALNEKAAKELMRLIHSTEVTYQAGIGDGSFGSAQDLFEQDFIDSVLANAAGVGAIKSLSGEQECKGDGSPQSGYIFKISYTKPTPDNISRFKAVAIAVIRSGDNRTGDHNFFVDETGVIRVSDTSEDIPDKNSKPIEE